MNGLDLVTITVTTALVIVVCALLYLLETLMRKDGAAGRLWAVAFLTGVLAVTCYLVWSIDGSAYIAVAFGNGAFVATAGFVWLGAVAYNGRSVRRPGIALAATVAAVVLAALLAGPDGGDWAGAVPMFLGNAVLAALGAVETRRGALAAQWSAIGLTLVLVVESAWFVARTVVFLVAGPDSPAFLGWFDSDTASLLTITLTIVVVVTTSVLRAGESTLRGQRDVITLHVATDGVLLPASFALAATRLLERAQRHGEEVCVLAVRIGDFDRMAVAFGPEEAEVVASAWRSGVRRHAPSAAIVGEGGATVLLTAFVVAPPVDVSRIAGTMHRRLMDDFAQLGISVLPVVGVGIASSDRFDYAYEALTAAAEDAASRAVGGADAAVIRAGGAAG